MEIFEKWMEMGLRNEVFLTIPQFFLSLILAIVLGFFVAKIYYITRNAKKYQPHFPQTIILLTVITSFMILLIGDNIARAIGVFGAFSIVRFRTSMKDSRDTAFVFFALAVGLGVGTGSFEMVIIGTAVIALLIFLLHFFSISE